MFGVQQARERVLTVIREGKWEWIEDQLTRYAGAVRAEERHRVVGEALEALTACGGEDGDTPVRDCLAAVEALR